MLSHKIFISFLFFLIFSSSFFVVFSFEITKEEEDYQKPCAFVTLIYNHDDGFVLGAKTLGYSLLHVNTRYDLIAMITEDISLEVQEQLEDAGWSLFKTKAISNPHSKYSPRFDFVFTKLQLFTLTEYRRVVYMDADMIALENIDELCDCGGEYCAVVRNTFFNAGLMVLPPSLETYQTMMERYPNTHSYEGGDQGFLNNYYWNPEMCDFFVPNNNNNNIDVDVVSSISHFSNTFDQQQQQTNNDNSSLCYRLPGYYNGDVGIYVARGDAWHFDPDENRTQPKIIHFTLSIFKPWNWLSYILLSCNWEWWYIYSTYSLDIDYFVLTLQVIPLVFYWCLVTTWKPFLQSFLRNIPKKYFLSRTTPIGRVIVGHLFQLCAIGGALYYSLLTLVDPSISIMLYFFTFYTLFDFLCIQLFEALFFSSSSPSSSSSTTENNNVPYNLLSKPSFVGHHHQNYFQSLSSKYNRLFYRVWVFSSKLIVLCIIWSYVLSIYGRIILLIVWAILVPAISHTMYCY